MSDHPKQVDASNSPPPRDPPGKLSPDEQRGGDSSHPQKQRNDSVTPKDRNH